MFQYFRDRVLVEQFLRKYFNTFYASDNLGKFFTEFSCHACLHFREGCLEDSQGKDDRKS